MWAVENSLPYGWSLTDVLLTDLFHAFTGEKHPARPKSSDGGATSKAASLRARLKAQRARLAEHPQN